MKILQELIASIESYPVEYVLIGTFDTAVVSRNCGLASTIRNDCPGKAYQKITHLGKLEEMDVKELACYSLSDNLLEATIGMAAINAGLSLPKNNFMHKNAKEIFLQKGQNKNAAIIGHFPFLEKMKDEFKNLFIIEKKPLPGDYKEEEISRIIPDIDVLALSATTLTNHSFERIMKYCSKNTYIIMLGPTTPLSPIIFDYGINAAGGVFVVDKKLALKYIRQGANFRMIKGLKYVMIFNNSKS